MLDVQRTGRTFTILNNVYYFELILTRNLQQIISRIFDSNLVPSGPHRVKVFSMVCSSSSTVNPVARIPSCRSSKGPVKSKDWTLGTVNTFGMMAIMYGPIVSTYKDKIESSHTDMPMYSALILAARLRLPRHTRG
eukprot:TRINITY_DN4105_c0_g1_i1.p1 TRINITY_DN4105_c0_g1~~TRINITY_DN4105_c0_g1_i1.p1  ORF type:complete len:136 (-),score=25.76 TRINITY_DN4105_c0_g1_i1:2-409(-)